ncbi:MAG: protein-methionine-sulfoxide reductase catalytic subunit MsrP [SAR324 cluster bacterium]|nr:protein-methionine-sulfoxide reductase catalytic subunit MsrP [SAR324 cluster bacterium]
MKFFLSKKQTTKKTPLLGKAPKITSEKIVWKRRKFLNSALLMALTVLFYKGQLWAKSTFNFKENKKYKASKQLTPSEEGFFTSYNNFYEFSFSKNEVKGLSQSLKIDPWQVEIGGLVENPLKLNIAELMDLASLESRVYRFRCVEAWSAVVPWIGYPLRHLIAKVKPQKKAKYVRFESFFDKNMANIPSTRHYPWPYTEGLRLDEANNDLALLTFGAYGKPLEKQNGAPVRMVVPWKYGFKSIKSIKRIDFVEEEPKSLWNALAPSEYGFYANVNPSVDHPRWSQKREKPLGAWLKRNETIFLNGYEDQVGALYKGMDLKKFI